MFLYGLSTVHSIYNIGLFAIVVAAMFVVPVISTIPAAIYHIIRILLK